MSKKLIFFDTETTGLSAENGDKIVEIGAIQMENGIISDKIFHTYLHPERNIPIESTKIHGITNEKVRNAPKFRDIVQDFLNFIKDATLVAHNASFDMRFVNFELKILGLSSLTNDVEDTLKIARKKFPGAPASLDALCKRFGVDLTERTFHGALLDSKLLACIYRKMVINDQINLNFNKDDFESRKEKKTIKPIRNHLCNVDDAEEILHKSFVSKWNFTI